MDGLDQVICDLQGDDPLAAVTVVVSSRRVGHSLRHLLARRSSGDGRSGVANVRFVTVADLADELGGTACRSGGRRRLTRSALGAAARVVLSSDPGVLAAVADQPTTEAELVTLYEELRHYPAETLDALARRRGFGRDLARLCLQMRSRLITDWYDDADLVGAAEDAIDAAETRGALGATVVVHLPERIRPDESRLIVAIARGCDLFVNFGITGDASADAPIAHIVAVLGQAGLELPSLAQMSDSDEIGFPQDSVRVDERIEAPDVDAEVRAAVRIVIDHIESGGTPTRVALLYPSAQSYLAALAAALGEANIAWNGRSPRRVAESPVARALLGIAELTQLGMARDRVMAWINSAPILDAHGDPLPVGAFERVSRLAGLTAGDASEWRRHLRALAEELTRRSGPADPSPQQNEDAGDRNTRARADLEAVRALGAFMADVGRSCEDAAKCANWTELELWARGVLRRYIGWVDADEQEREGADASVDAILAELGRLDSIEPSASIDDFVRAFDAALERTGTFEGRLSSGVAVLSLWDAVGLDCDLALVLGGVEGELPPRARSSPLLSSDDRVALGLDAATSEAASAAARHALVAVNDSSRRTVCTWRLRDSGETKARVRSRFFGHDDVTLAPSPVGALGAVAMGEYTALSERELVVATLRSRRAARRDLSSFHLVRGDLNLGSALRVASSRVAYRFDRFDGRISTANGIDAEKVLSPTTLESYARCPFRYFLSSELGVDVVEAPEQRIEIDRRERGSIAHEVLEHFVADLIAADGELASVDTAAHLLFVAQRVFGQFERLGRTGAPVLWARERRALLSLLERERQSDALRRAREQRTPVALEWVFGAGDVPPLEVPVRAGRVAFRGKVDRIDRRADGGLAIVDYKTGRSVSFEGLAADPVDGGRHLQLAIYALAARALLDDAPSVSASYRFLDEEREELTVALDDNVVARTSEVVGVIADGVSAGLYPFNPGAAGWKGFENCKYCDFNSVCPPDRDDFWEEASKEAELEPYVALLGGDDDE